MSAVVRLDNGLKLKVNKDDHNPPHAHVEGKGGEARINLRTFRVMTVEGYSRNDIRKIIEAVKHYAPQLWAKWDEYHGKKEEI